MSRAYRMRAMSPKRPEMSRPHGEIHGLVRPRAYSFFFFGGTTQSGLLGLDLAGGADFLLGAAFGAALVRLLGAAVLDDFFLGSALVSGRFLFRLEAGRVVSVSAAFVLALDLDLLAGALVSAGSAAGRRELRRFVVAGASSSAFFRLAAVPDLVFVSSAGVEAVPERVRDRVDGLGAGVASASREPEPPDLGLAVVELAAVLGSPAFGVAGVAPR